MKIVSPQMPFSRTRNGYRVPRAVTTLARGPSVSTFTTPDKSLRSRAIHPRRFAMAANTSGRRARRLRPA